MVARSSVEKITCVCGEVVLSCRNQNYLKVVSKMLVLSRRLREAQGMDRNYIFNYLVSRFLSTCHCNLRL